MLIKLIILHQIQKYLEFTQTIMSSRPRLEVQGQAPFKQSGIYEVQIFIVDSKPSVDQIRNKQFSSLWKGHFHLRVKDGTFTEILGSDENPIPSSVYDLDSVWIVVADLFSSLHSIFDVSLGKPSKETKSETRTEIESPKPRRTVKTTPDSFTAYGYAGPQGDKGSTGPQGVSGDKGQSGDKGPTGPQGVSGDKGPQGDKGTQGEKGITGDKGDKGDKGVSGTIGDKGDKGPTGQLGDKGPQGDKGSLGPQGERGLTGPLGDKGQVGVRGITGDQGDKGPLGPQGPSGDKGLTGPSGPLGEKGPL